MCKYTYFLLTRFCCLVFVRRFNWHAPGGPLRPELSCGGGTTARAKFFCGVSTSARAGPCCPGPLTGRVFGENAPEAFQKSPSGRESGTNAPEAPQYEPRRAHFRLNRAQNTRAKAGTSAHSPKTRAKHGVSGRNEHTFARIVREYGGKRLKRAQIHPKRARNTRAKAGTSTLSPKTRAKLGVRGRNARTFVKNARGERIARQCPAAEPEMRVDGPACVASPRSRNSRVAKAWQISSWKSASKIVGGGCFQKGLHNS